MKVLILIAHPNVDKSCNHAIANAAAEHLKSKGHETRIVDLYKIKFDPVGGPNDFKKVTNEKFFDYQVEQKYAIENDNFADDVKEQIENLKWADTLIYQFPLYWWTIPAILKGYQDKCFSYYFAYGGGNSMKLNIMYSTTSGGNYSARLPKIFSYDKWRDFGNKIIPAFYLHGIMPWVGGWGGKTDEESFLKRQKECQEKMKKHLDENLLNDKGIKYDKSGGW